jgi:predicted transcriptional regulator
MTPREFLENAAGTELPLKELLRVWGFSTRSHQAVFQVGSALAGVGLTTDPRIEAARDTRQVVKIVQLVEESSGAFVGDTEVAPPVLLTVGELLGTSRRGVLAVGIIDSLQYAQTLMMEHDYSQLAVVDGRNLRGAVTWESIVAAHIAGSGGELRHAMMQDPVPILHPSDGLLDKIPTICDMGFAFVSDENDPLIAIITTADLAARFGNLAGPFFLISEIERRLRRHIERVCSVQNLRSMAPSFKPPMAPDRINSVNDLTFGQCRYLLKDPDIWKRLGWDLAHGIFCDRLEEVNRTRNEIMHFRPEPVTRQALEQLQKVVSSLRKLDRQS